MPTAQVDWNLLLWRPGPRTVSGNMSRITPERPVTAHALEEAFPGAFPAWLRAEMVTRMAAQPLHGFGATVFSSQLHAGPGVALVGDSGHSMSITLGHGCNTGLESSKVFCDLLERSIAGTGPPLDEVTAAYSRARLPQVHAMQRIERSSALGTGHYEARSVVEKWNAQLVNWVLARARDLKKRLGERGEWVRTMDDLSGVEYGQAEVWAPVRVAQWGVVAVAVATVAVAVAGAQRVVGA